MAVLQRESDMHSRPMALYLIYNWQHSTVIILRTIDYGCNLFYKTAALSPSHFIIINNNNITTFIMIVRLKLVICLENFYATSVQDRVAKSRLESSWKYG